MTELAEKVLSGNRRAVGQALTLVENGEGNLLLSHIYPHTGHAHTIGITGAPGTGKSTLITALVRAWRGEDKTVGVLAVDPSSPFTGGALLGDRIRMLSLSGDPGVFIRSCATRGASGAISYTIEDAICVLDAAGFDIILVETVGAGQSEVDIVNTVQTTMVVEAPGLGDGIQAIKAGILEIADIFVVNKADRPSAANAVRALEAMLALGHPITQPSTEETDWIPEIVETVATEGTGVESLIHAIHKHREYLIDHAKIRNQRRTEHALARLKQRLAEALLAELLAVLPAETLQRTVARVTARELHPNQAVYAVLDARYPTHPSKEEADDGTNTGQ